MEWSDVWKLLNSPVVIAALAAGLLWALNRVYAAKPAWKGFEGSIITAIKLAEKMIPDDAENKSVARLDRALKYVLDIYEQARGKPADEKTKAAIREGINIVHADLEATRILRGAPPAEA